MPKLGTLGVALIVLVVIGGALYFMSRKPESEISKLYSTQLSISQFGFVFLGSSGILLRTRNLAVAIDVAGYLSDSQISDIPRLDLLIYTHVHSDHFNAEVAQKIYNATKCLVFGEPSVCDSLLGKIPFSKLFSITGGEEYRLTIGGRDVIVRTVAGLHTVNITLIYLEADGLKIFHGGDSGYTPRLAFFGRVDAAFLPVGGASPSASPDDATEMAVLLQPKIIVLFHGNSDQYSAFRAEVKLILNAAIVVPDIGKLYIEDISS